MARFLLESVTLLLVAWPICQGAVDYTVMEKAKGPEVVEATVDRIQGSCAAFDDDKLMLRRIAYVETTDGEDDDTFDIYGGIWQITESNFDTTKTDITSQMRDDIDKEFGIDWSVVVYKDLLKPLYSALAARIWIEIKMDEQSIDEVPRSIDHQADFWAAHYDGSAASSTYTNKVAGINDECETPRADFLFVLDGSGSIGSDNFVVMKDFVKDIVSSTNVGDDKVRVGLIQYDDNTYVEFYMGKYDSVSNVNSAIDKVRYQGSGTASHLALRETVSEFEKRGRTGIPQVCIFITDGQSNDPEATKQAAYDLHNHASLGVTVFAVGIANAVMSELETIGSDPSCLHVHMLENFEDMDHFKAQLEKQTCATPAVLNPGDDTSGTVISGRYVFFKFKVTRKGVTIKLRMRSGATRLYVSYKFRNPGRIIYDLTLRADSSTRLIWKTLHIPFPAGLTGVNTADVFMSLLGEGIGQPNNYHLGFNAGTGLKAALMTLLAAAVMGLLLKQA